MRGGSRPSLPFFDVEVTIHDREFDVSEHHKPTFWGARLHFKITAPMPWKRGIITCLMHCAYSYSSNDPLLETEINFIISLFKRNGYPTSFILKVIDRFINIFTNNNQQFSTDSPNSTHNSNPYLTLPYIGTPSIKLGKLIDALSRDRLSTDIRIAKQTFEIIFHFNLKYSLCALFCSNIVLVTRTRHTSV